MEILQNDPSANRVKEVSKGFAVVPVAYASLMDLGKVFMRRGVQIANGTDAPIQIKFLEGEAGENILTIPASTTKTYDVRCYGEIDYQYAVGAPSLGTFTVSVW